MTDNIFRNKQVPTRLCACGECWKRPADETCPKVEQTSDGYEKAIYRPGQKMKRSGKVRVALS